MIIKKDVLKVLKRIEGRQADLKLASDVARYIDTYALLEDEVTQLCICLAIGVVSGSSIFSDAAKELEK